MNKNLLLLSLFLIPLIFVTSCSKGDDTPSDQPEQKKYSVELSVGGFSEVIDDIKSNTPETFSDSLSKHISVLYSRIYNTNTGQLVFSEDQSKGVNSKFGTIGSLLANGDYTAVFIGSQSSLQVNSGLFNTGGFSTGNALYDTFYKKVKFSIVNQGVTESVQLERVIAGLNVIIEDAIPAGISKIEIIIPDDQISYSFIDDNRLGASTRTVEFSLTAADQGLINKTLKTLAFKINSPTSVIIKTYNTNNILHSQTTIPNVTFFANKTTSLKGKLFSFDTDFDVTPNSVWDSPPPVVSF